MKRKKLIVFFIVLFAACLAIYFYSCLQERVRAENLFWGSRGGQVYEVQRRLKQWGYYDGSIDGIYGYETYRAVKKFQWKNGLRVDGIVGPQTKRALGMPVRRTRYDASRGVSARDNLYILAQLISGEARGEPYIGQVAVGAVVLNRVEHPSFPNTIPGVVFQPGAFTAVLDGQMFRQPNSTAIRAAVDALSGWDPTGGALYYYNPRRTTNNWIWSRPVIKVIGKHRFAR